MTFNYPHPEDGLEDLRRALRDNAATVAVALLGPPNRKHSTRQQLRFGRDKGSLSVEIGRKNPGTWYDWSTDEAGDMFGLIRYAKGCDFTEAKRIAAELTGAPVSAPQYAPRSHIVLPNTTPDPGTTKFAGQLWREGVEPRGTIVEAYLRSRGLFEVLDEFAGSVIRYHAPFYCSGRTAAAMVALFRDIKTDEPVGVSVTFLNKNAEKLDRRFFGHVGAGAIKFSGFTDTLSIGEGIESTLSGAVLGYSPAWALGSASAIARFPVVAGVTTLRIFGEKGDNGANAKAVKQLVTRWQHSGADIYVIDPKIGNDLNDALMSESLP